MIKLLQGDCLKRMTEIPDKSIDMILADPPYGTTACKWDSIIPLEPMWEQLNRIIKPNGAIVLFGSEPFSSALRMSNIKNYKYDWIWVKNRANNPMLAKKRPLNIHDNIIIFYQKTHNYMPQKDFVGIKDKRKTFSKNLHDVKTKGTKLYSKCKKDDGTRYPKSVIKYNLDQGKKLFHPTQKPVALMEYLIKTYTNEGETVLDFVMGSGITGVACKRLNRGFVGIELDPHYFEIAKNRIASTGEPLFVLQ